MQLSLLPKASVVVAAKDVVAKAEDVDAKADIVDAKRRVKVVAALGQVLGRKVEHQNQKMVPVDQVHQNPCREQG